MGIQVCMGNLGGAIACNIYRTRDEPRYLLGRRSIECAPQFSKADLSGRGFVFRWVGDHVPRLGNRDVALDGPCIQADQLKSKSRRIAGTRN